MASVITDRADKVRREIEVLNGADSIALLEFLLQEIGNDKNFIAACEGWLRNR